MRRLWLWAIGAALLLAPLDAGAQRLSYNSGQPIAPAYEGFERNPDGSFTLMFGYMNQNWEQEPDVPVGADNSFSPGPADRGQPTHFFPRRNRFVFKINVPADFGTEELVWTLTVNGQTVKAYASLKPDYALEPITIISEKGGIGGGGGTPEVRKNTAPTLHVEGPHERTVKVGEPMRVILQALDDGLPPARSLDGGNARTRSETRVGTAGAAQAADVQRQAADPNAIYRRPPQRSTVSSATGLRVVMYHYRGVGKVAFDPPQIKLWEDTRAGANSPHGPAWVPPPLPPDGRIMVHATFDKPGTYILRCVADDGGMWDDKDIQVTVTP